MTLASALIRSHIRRQLAAALAVPLAALTPASGAMAGETVTIRIDNFTFGPETVTVAPGTAVTWINGDDIPHTVVSQSKLFRSKTLDTDDRYSFTFDAPGEYPYFCSLHPHMTGKVVVKAPAG
ncbi:cupredoxin domain-containing protein [Methylobacterium brachythecii]|uniref:Amicyanin n=1 Tax=Methylobacterium brachythecii TaxID=1176177 RepID=A0A7W6AGF3_9HYPH|nr:cupredoxin family copper-binding protein [Methylobacterium brachythecii]MBB3902873.1 plastocyanin [Methylobacterium brachythecii]GLS43799.1 amicyanin [Methylobacterium brachythecii]